MSHLRVLIFAYCLLFGEFVFADIFCVRTLNGDLVQPAYSPTPETRGPIIGIHRFEPPIEANDQELQKSYLLEGHSRDILTLKYDNLAGGWQRVSIEQIISGNKSFFLYRNVKGFYATADRTFLKLIEFEGRIMDFKLDSSDPNRLFYKAVIQNHGRSEEIPFYSFGALLINNF